MSDEFKAAAVDAIVKHGLFVEVNGGELEHIATVYTPEGQALVILHALKRAGLSVVRSEP